MGTGVGEAALAAEAIGAAEAAGAVAGSAGLTEAALLGGEYAGGLGLTGALTEGIGSMAALGGEYGGLSSLAPAFQQATNATAVFNPETAAQVVQATNAGAIPTAGTPLGYGQVGDPALAQITQAFQNAPTSAQTAAMYGPGTQVAAAPGVGADTVMGDVLSKGSRGIYDLGATDMSLGDAGRAAEAAGISSTPSAAQTAANMASMPAPTAADVAQMANVGPAEATKSGFDFTKPFSSAYNWYKEQDAPTRYGLAGLGAMQAAKAMNKPQGVAAPEKYSGPLSKFSYSPDTYTPYTYKPYAAGGPVEEMSRENAIGANTGYPQSDIQQGAYATPWQTPVSRNVVANAGDVGVDQMTGMERMAGGGIANLGGYSDGGRLLKGPGDGMSDNIPATIGSKQPARLADGEFVVSADVVSGLGNGSTEAGAKKLYKMMDRVRQARTGTKKQGKEIKPEKYTPA